MKNTILKSRKTVGSVLVVIPAVTLSLLTMGLKAAAGSAQDSRPGQNPDSVAAVVERYVQACGGSALAEVTVEKRKGTLVRGQSGQVPLTAISKAPGKWLYNQVFAYGEQASYGCDGTTAWLQNTKGVDSMDAAMRLDLDMLLDVQAPLKLGQFFPEMRLKGVEKIDGREMVLILAKSRDGREEELAFDRESGLLMKAGDLRFEDYRSVGKVKRFYRAFIGDDPGGLGLQLKMDWTEIVQNGPAQDSDFLRPSCPLPLRVSPLFQPRHYIHVSEEAVQACVGIYQHPTNPSITYTATRQQNHLMMRRTGWGQALEIMPESELDYSIRFMNFEFHFVKDSSGLVAALEIGQERAIRAMKIK